MLSNIHRGRYLQRGRGLGGLFSSIFRVLKPLFAKGTKHLVSAGAHALKDPEVKTALTSIKSAALQSGTKAVTQKIKQQEKALLQKLRPEEKAVAKAKKRIAASPTETKSKKSRRKNRLVENTIFS